MRPKLPAGEKRSCIIGLKVKPETKRLVERIAISKGFTLSSYIDFLLCKDIENWLNCSDYTK